MYDEGRRCSICDSPIGDYNETGVGAECRAAHDRAVMKAIFSIDGVSLKYNWLIEVGIYKEAFIKAFKETKFRSEWKKGFYTSISKADRISKKQLAIMADWLFQKNPDITIACGKNTTEKKKEYVKELFEKDITINRAAIEQARREIRASKIK